MWWALTVSLKIDAGKSHIVTVSQFGFFYIYKLLSCSLHSLKPQPLLQPHVSHQLSCTLPSPCGSHSPGLLVPLHVPRGFLLPAARPVWPLLLARPSRALCPVLLVHPAEVWGWPWARCAATVFYHGSLFHDRTCGCLLAPGRRVGFTGRENRPLGHSDQAA